ncbi:MAG: hypothetical protein HGN29_00565 [Asgard group archaeon]|nr:hypothetical protein [Asgard group archaeon]
MSEEKKNNVVGLGSCTMDIIFPVDDVMRMELSVFNDDTTAISVILLTPWEKDSSIFAYKAFSNVNYKQF